MSGRDGLLEGHDGDAGREAAEGGRCEACGALLDPDGVGGVLDKDLAGAVTFEVMWPPKELTPNAKRRKHWRSYSDITARYRQDCKDLAIAAKAKGRIVAVTFHPPDRRRRDDDGMIGAFKAGRDGIAEATGVDDHKFRPQYRFGEPVRGGSVIVTTAP